MPRSRRSIPTTIAFGVLTVVLTIALLVGWILVLIQHLYLTDRVVLSSWLLTLGSASFVEVITVLVLFSTFLVREIRTVRRQTGFIDSVTHEFKSPLASLKLSLETLEREDVQESVREVVRRRMAQDVERLTILIDDVLEASRLSEPWKGQRIERVALGDLVARCAAATRACYDAPEDSMKIRISPALEVATDPNALELILKNLLDNAVKYSAGLDNPIDVEVEAKLEEEWLDLTIRDRGIGIDRQHCSKIFDRFYRAPTEIVRSRPGTGLGLFVVSELVRALKGEILVTSETGPVDRRGTRFRLRIPVSPAGDSIESKTRRKAARRYREH